MFSLLQSQFATLLKWHFVTVPYAIVVLVTLICNFMLTKIFLKLTDYPFFRRLIWKPVYELLSKKFKVKDWSFMNYGSAPSSDEPFLQVGDEDGISRYPFQLY